MSSVCYTVFSTQVWAYCMDLIVLLLIKCSWMCIIMIIALIFARDIHHSVDKALITWNWNYSKFNKFPVQCFPFSCLMLITRNLMFPLITSFMPPALPAESKQGGVRGKNSPGGEIILFWKSLCWNESEREWGQTFCNKSTAILEKSMTMDGMGGRAGKENITAISQLFHCPQKLSSLWSFCSS